MKHRLSSLLRQQLTLQTRLGISPPTGPVTTTHHTISLVGHPLPHTHPHLHLHLLTHAHWSTVNSSSTLNAHLLIFHLDPIDEYDRLQSLRRLLPSIHQPVIILINSTVPSQLLEPLLAKSLPSRPTTIFFNPLSPHKHNHHPSPLNQAIRNALKNPEGEPSEENQIRLALSLSELALSQTSQRLLGISEELQAASQRLHVYQLRLGRLKKRATHIQLPPSSPPTATIIKSLSKHIGLSTLPFGSHLVGFRALRALEKNSLDRIEKDLIFQAGQVELLRENAQEVIDELVSDPLLKPYRSESDLNRLFQARAKHLAFPQATGSLGIFAHRKRQLMGLGGPLYMLQTKATALFRNNLLAGIGLSVFSFSNYFAQPLPHTFDSLLSHHQPTVSIFLLVLIIYHSQASWIQSLRAFGNDLIRWNDSLTNDLLIQHHKIVEQIFHLSHRPAFPSSLTKIQEQQMEKAEVDLVEFIRRQIEARMEVPEEEIAQLKTDPLFADLLANYPPPLTFVQWTDLTRRILSALKQQLIDSQPPTVPPPSSS